MDFTGRHFPKDLILQTIRWYLRYSLSYRDIEEILEERGVEIDHTTPYRWVQEYAMMYSCRESLVRFTTSAC